MARSTHTLEAGGIRLQIDLTIGHIASLEVEAAGRILSPLHRAAWADDPSTRSDEALPPNVRGLSGEFFCAPFGLSDIEAAPAHGWPANSAWQPVDVVHTADGVTARFALEKRICGARLTKEITLRNGHPFVYQRHIFEGGQGSVSVAHHPMVRFSGTGRLSFSPKRWVETPPTPLETDPSRGRCALAYPARGSLDAFPLGSGESADLRNYPIASRHEDFVVLAEADHDGPGWAAAMRDPERDVLVILKDPAELPLTMLWYSNGGRDYAPWNGRHTSVLGIEDARCYSAFGHAAATRDNPYTEKGIPTAFALDAGGIVTVRHVIGVLPAPAGWKEIDRLSVSQGILAMVNASGMASEFPFRSGFLEAPL